VQKNVLVLFTSENLEAQGRQGKYSKYYQKIYPGRTDGAFFSRIFLVTPDFNMSDERLATCAKVKTITKENKVGQEYVIQIITLDPLEKPGFSMSFSSDKDYLNKASSCIQIPDSELFIVFNKLANF
jgi:hypothetical protein